MSVYKIIFNKSNETGARSYYCQSSHVFLCLLMLNTDYVKEVNRVNFRKYLAKNSSCGCLKFQNGSQ